MTKEKLQQRMLQVWLHSYIYYELDDSIISDHQWNEWAKELAEHINDPIFKTIKHHEIFEGFDGSTGFDIAKKATPNLINKAKQLLVWDRRRS